MKPNRSATRGSKAQFVTTVWRSTTPSRSPRKLMSDVTWAERTHSAQKTI